MLSNPEVGNPYVWKMRNSVEPIPSGKRDHFRTARGIIWWSSASLAFWFVAALVLLSI